MTSTFNSATTRAVKALAANQFRKFDVVILGGGINGVGLFRDLCEQGISCLLVEKNDYGSGTSAAPSRLIHGGLKYLETGEFGLVAQSTLERNLLLHNAPHYVQSLSTVIPIFSWTKGTWSALRTLFGSTNAPRSRGALLVKIGLTLYDFYGSRHRVMPSHRLLTRRRALKELPILTKSIVAAGNYYDAKVTQPERLVYELVQDGIDACPSSAAINATSLIDTCNNQLIFKANTGEEFSVETKLVVNATGPWIDKTNALLGEPSTMIGGTKGSHILLKHDELVKALNGRMIYFEADDGRICLVLEYLGRALVGSTDISADDPDDVRCDDSEISYFLESLRSLLPELGFSRDQIVYAYSGIRPLPASDAALPGLISRDHSAPVLEPNDKRAFPIISLVGGKWTTFRGFAEEVANTILNRLGRKRAVSTRNLAIGGGKNFPKDSATRLKWLTKISAETGFECERLDQLLSRYGTTARKIAQHRCEWSDAERLPDAKDYSLAEIDWIIKNEAIVHLSDVVMRRTTLAVRGTVTIQDIKKIGEVAATSLGWDREQTEDEVGILVKQLEEKNLCNVEL